MSTGESCSMLGEGGTGSSLKTTTISITCNALSTKLTNLSSLSGNQSNEGGVMRVCNFWFALKIGRAKEHIFWERRGGGV